MKQATTTQQSKEVLNNVTGEAIRAAWGYLHALGFFTSPTDEGRRVENLLIQARCEEQEVKTAIAETYNKGYNPAAMDELYKSLELQATRLRHFHDEGELNEQDKEIVFDIFLSMQTALQNSKL